MYSLSVRNKVAHVFVQFFSRAGYAKLWGNSKELYSAKMYMDYDFAEDYFLLSNIYACYM